MSVDIKSMFSGLMENAKKMQSQFSEGYQALAKEHEGMLEEGIAGGGLVRVVVNLKFEVQHIELSNDLFQEKPSVISELIMAAVNVALSKAQKKLKESMLKLGQKIGLPANMPMPFGS